jgi:hypothetical protein
MRCEHVQDRALECILAGEELPVGLRPHLESCQECTAEVARLRLGVRAAKSLRQSAVAPPPGMKKAVFDAIASAPAGEPATRRASWREAVGAACHWLVVRPLPVAAAAFVLVAVTVVGVATNGSKLRKEAWEIHFSVAQSRAVPDCERLEREEWIQKQAAFLNAVNDAKLQLQIVAVDGDLATVRAAARGVRARRLVESFRAIENAAPEGDRRLASEVRYYLEEIANLQP